MLIDGPAGPLELLITGRGEPVTVFGHGLASSIAETRPFGSGVLGTRAFLSFRGHGASAAPESSWTYAALADELRAAADRVGASQALGVSLGAGALTTLLAATPDRFDRVVLVLPAVLDRPRSAAVLDRFTALAQLIDERDVEGAARLLRAEQPAKVRDTPVVRLWSRRQAQVLCGTPVSRALRELPTQTALDDPTALRDARVPVLLVAQEDDPSHPVQVARDLADVLPDAELVVLPAGGVLWRHRARVRELVAGFFSGPARV